MRRVVLSIPITFETRICFSGALGKEFSAALAEPARADLAGVTDTDAALFEFET